MPPWVRRVAPAAGVELRCESTNFKKFEFPPWLLQGRASSWQDHVVLTSTGGGAGGRSNKEVEQLAASEVAKIFEGRLADTLLAEDGQLSLSNLAINTFATLLPKIETQGQLGKARWRLVSAPSIPGLLSLEPGADPGNLLSSLTLGTEAEIQLGSSLQVRAGRDG